MNLNLCFRQSVLLEMISFKKMFEEVAQKFPMQCKQSLYKVFVCLLHETVVNSFLS